PAYTPRMEINNTGLLSRLAQLRKSGDATALKQTQQQLQEALTAEIKDMVGASIQGWSTPHAEKAAFPFQVDKQARKWSPVAQAQLSSNLAAASGILVNPQIDSALLMSVETRMDPQAKPLPQDLNNPEFQRFYNDVRGAATKSSTYSFEGTLVNVGWG